MPTRKSRGSSSRSLRRVKPIYGTESNAALEVKLYEEQEELFGEQAEEMPLRRRTSAAQAEPQQAEEVVYEEVTRPQRSHAVSGALRIAASMFTFLFVTFFLGACLYEIYGMREQYREIERNMAQLEEQLSAEKAVSLQNKIDQTYYTSDKYREDMARNRFRLIYDGEILITIGE